MVTKREVREAAAVLRRLLDAVERGDIRADGSLGAGIVRRLEGAIAALGALADVERRDHPGADGR